MMTDDASSLNSNQARRLVVARKNGGLPPPACYARSPCQKELVGDTPTPPMWATKERTQA